MDDLSPEERAEQDALRRILERFVIFTKKHIEENFQNHPEADFNKNLISESVVDMTYAASIYEKVFGGNVYDNSQTRIISNKPFSPTQPLIKQPLSQPQQRPQQQLKPPTRPGDDMSLLEALSAFGSQSIGSGTASMTAAANPDGSPNLTQPLSPEQIESIRVQQANNAAPPTEIVTQQENLGESEISRIMKHNAGLVNKP